MDDILISISPQTIAIIVTIIIAVIAGTWKVTKEFRDREDRTVEKYNEVTEVKTDIKWLKESINEVKDDVRENRGLIQLLGRKETTETKWYSDRTDKQKEESLTAAVANSASDQTDITTKQTNTPPIKTGGQKNS